MTPPPAVSNSSPLIALDQIGLLHLLENLFSRVWIPTAVSTEVEPTVALPDWIEVHPLAHPVGARILGASLGAGESETISLALESEARWVILDERPARRLALALSLPVIGTLGILLTAKRRGLIPAVRPCVESLIRSGFHLSPAIYQNVLADAGETDE